MPFRCQPYAERCVGCEEPAARGCPRCRAPLCGAHACDPYGCCEGCATDMYFAVSRAGKRTVLGGGVVTAVSTGGLYALYALQMFPVMIAAMLAAGLATGFITMVWGGSISPRLADRALRRQLKHPQLLVGSVAGDGTVPP